MSFLCFPILSHYLLFGAKWCLKPRFASALANNQNTAHSEWERSQRGYLCSVERLARGLCSGYLWNVSTTAWCCWTAVLIWPLLWLSYTAVSGGGDASLDHPLPLAVLRDISLFRQSWRFLWFEAWRGLLPKKRWWGSCLSTSISLFLV